MSTLPPDAVATVASTLFAGLFMLHLALRKRATRWRSSTRCPSCGVIRRMPGRCDHCTR